VNTSPSLGIVAVSQRVVVDPPHGERRDALDQRLLNWLALLGAQPVPIPNHPPTATALLERLAIQSVVLTGGNDLAALGGDAPERDTTEFLLASHAERHCMPLLGLCRGFQFLVHRDGGQLQRGSGHAGTRHVLEPASLRWGPPRQVNSFHDFLVERLPDSWEPIGRAADGAVEAALCKERGWLGLMWHPEREAAPDQVDLRWARACLSGQLRVQARGRGQDKGRGPADPRTANACAP
jgi:putative glutamine amidotransferase